MIHRLALLSLLIASFACSAKDENKPKSTVPPDPEPKMAVQAVEAAIASVRMMEDCPDPKPAVEEAAKEESMEDQGDSEADDDGTGYSHCTQSTVQIAFVAHGDGPAKVAVVAVRLLGPKGETLDTLKTRLPTQWKDNSYQPWDELIAPKIETRASYKLSVPNWNTVEAKAGNTFSSNFSIEMDLEIDGAKKTLRSSSFVREQPEMIET